MLITKTILLFLALYFTGATVMHLVAIIKAGKGSFGISMAFTSILWSIFYYLSN